MDILKYHDYDQVIDMIESESAAQDGA